MPINEKLEVRCMGQCIVSKAEVIQIEQQLKRLRMVYKMEQKLQKNG